MFEYGFGAVPLDAGRVRFRLWAPDASSVDLEREGHAPVRMPRAEDGFHELVCEGAPGMRYRYRMGAGACVADPASRQQDGDVHDASIVTDASAYAWRNNDWRGLPWTQTVLYEIHPGLAGGFRGVQERLADLAELGVTAVELMPIGDFAGPRNWGYDGVLPYAPDCAYGTPDDLRLLIDTAHGMGMQVFLDVVYNHFGPEGNYLGDYASGFFNRKLRTPWGDGIDFEKRQVRRFFAENALYWLKEFRFDGLRLDAAHAIADRGWLEELPGFLRSHLDPDRHVHLVLEHEDNAAGLLRRGFDAQWNDDAHHVLHHILTGEAQGYYAAYADDPAGKLARCLAQGFVYQGGPNPAREGRPHGEPTEGLPPSAFVFFLQNHDQTGNRAFGERLSSLCGQRTRKLRAAVALQMLTPHIPMLFMGEECGATAPFLYFTSFGDPDLQRRVRDGRRREFSAFHPPAGAEGGTRSGSVPPDPGSMKTWEASRVAPGVLDARALSWRAFYKELLGARRACITPHLSGAAPESAEVIDDVAVLARWRLGNGSLLRLYANFSGGDIVLAAGAADRQRVIFSSHDQGGAALKKDRLPAECVVATVEPGPAAEESAAREAE